MQVKNIYAAHNKQSLFCPLCQQSLPNESMKRGRLDGDLQAKYKFKLIKENFEKKGTLIKLECKN